METQTETGQQPATDAKAAAVEQIEYPCVCLLKVEGFDQPVPHWDLAARKVAMPFTIGLEAAGVMVDTIVTWQRQFWETHLDFLSKLEFEFQKKTRGTDLMEIVEPDADLTRDWFRRNVATFTDARGKEISAKTVELLQAEGDPKSLFVGSRILSVSAYSRDEVINRKKRTVDVDDLAQILADTSRQQAKTFRVPLVDSDLVTHNVLIKLPVAAPKGNDLDRYSEATSVATDVGQTRMAYRIDRPSLNGLYDEKRMEPFGLAWKGQRITDQTAADWLKWILYHFKESALGFRYRGLDRRAGNA